MSLALDLQIIFRTPLAIWAQYCDLRAAKRTHFRRPAMVVPAKEATSSVQSFSL